MRGGGGEVDVQGRNKTKYKLLTSPYCLYCTVQFSTSTGGQIKLSASRIFLRSNILKSSKSAGKFSKRFFWPRSCSLCYCWDICQPSRLEYLLPAGKHKLITYRGIVFSKPAWFYVFSLPVSFYIIQITRINNGKHCKSTYSIVLYE